MIQAWALECPQHHSIFWCLYDETKINREEAAQWCARMKLAGQLNDKCLKCGQPGEDLGHSTVGVATFTSVEPLKDVCAQLPPACCIVLVIPDTTTQSLKIQGIELTQIRMNARPAEN